VLDCGCAHASFGHKALEDDYRQRKLELMVQKLRSVIAYDWDGFLASGKKSLTLHTGEGSRKGAVGVLPLFGQFYVANADVHAASTFNININSKKGSTVTWVWHQAVWLQLRK
jgi:hypothetical protein